MAESDSAAFAKSAAYMGAVLATVGEGIITIDSEETILFMNEEAERLWGIEPGEYIGSHCHRLMPDRYKKPHSAALRRYIEKGGKEGVQRHVEVMGLRRDDSEFWLELRFTSVEVGGQMLFTSSARDISERRERTRQLQQRVELDDVLTRISTRFINAPVEDIGPGIDKALRDLGQHLQVDRGWVFVVPDLASKPWAGRDRRFDREAVSMAHEWCADGVAPMLEGLMNMQMPDDDLDRRTEVWFKAQLAEQKIVRVDSLDTVEERFREGVRRRLEPLGVKSRILVSITTEGVANGILGFDTTIEEHTWSDEEAQVLQLAGPVIANAVLRKDNAEALQAAHDDLEKKVEERTAELKEKHAQLLQSEKLASLGQLVAGVAHEINTPLGSIKSNNDTLLRALSKLSAVLGPDADPKKVEKYLGSAVHLGEVSKEAIERIATLVFSLRSFARLDKAELDSFDLHEGIDSTLSLVRHELKHRVTVEKDYGDLPPVECFANQINQVFMNVLVNGAQAIEGKGTIVIKTRPEGEGASVTFTDSGRGMEADTRARIFDPGFTTKGVGVGTGLGMSIVHQIIERHGGHIEVDSEVGKGTSVRIVLPRRPPPTPSEAPAGS